ncbi:putative effector of murein hydrolase LrgA (UPF0299 family) [Parabacteroides sp. PFB2-10]|uniref:hypothetical protein n=1 Tax=Parabacteroides sp. PFB2-10 TaxID=1742405 RepID=UPI00247649C2|nr:hypothetical protein [Parabacteroides sp. PFB2-10]MDH6311284.1 putative effector of murein hydrolase LrgA (UPF0299 family) [Parabacteroides sp. PFB2-10]
MTTLLTILGIIAIIAFIQYEKEVSFKQQGIRVIKIFIVQYLVVLLLIGCVLGVILLLGDQEGSRLATQIARIKSGAELDYLWLAPFHMVKSFVTALCFFHTSIMLAGFLGLFAMIYLIRRLYRKWHPLKSNQKALLYLISPLTLTFLPFGVFSGICFKESYSITHQYTNRKDIASMIGIDFPKYIETDRALEGNSISFNGDYSVSVRMKFTKDNDLDKFYREFESIKIDSPFYNHSSSDNKCSFSRMDDYTFVDLTINKSDSIISLRYGRI